MKRIKLKESDIQRIVKMVLNEQSGVDPEFNKILKFTSKLYEEGITDYDKLCEIAFKVWDKSDPYIRELVHDGVATELENINLKNKELDIEMHIIQTPSKHNK